MADMVLVDEILMTLEQKEVITVDRDSDFKNVSGINPEWSNTKVKRALGHLVSNRKVVRIRRELQGCSDTGGPITYRLILH